MTEADGRRRSPVLASASWRALGTGVAVIVVEPASLTRCCAAVRRQLEEIDLAASRFRDDSELAGVNRAAGRWVAVSPLFLTVLEAALHVARATGGSVDPTLGRALALSGYDRDFDRLARPVLRRIRVVETCGWRSVEVDRERRRVRLPRGVELDLGATAKAFAADRAAQTAAGLVGAGVLVNLGGDLSVAGKPPAGGWAVRVTDDHAAGHLAPGQTVSITSGGLATSSTTVRRWTADGRRLHHILDPRTGRPAPEVWRTVSVAAASCVDANAASTASVVRGRPAPDWLAQIGLPARLVDGSGRVVTVAGWPGETRP